MKIAQKKVGITYLLSALWLFNLSCAGDGSGLAENGNILEPNSSTVSFSSDIQPIFNEKCIICHQPGGSGYSFTGGANSGLDLKQGFSYSSLVNVSTFQASGVSPFLRVDPGNSANSYLYQKVYSGNPKDGGRMPLNGPPFLSGQQIQKIKTWIDSGAQNN